MRYLIATLVLIFAIGCSSNKQLTQIDTRFSEVVSAENFNSDTANKYSRTTVIGDSTVVVSNGGNQ